MFDEAGSPSKRIVFKLLGKRGKKKRPHDDQLKNEPQGKREVKDADLPAESKAPETPPPPTEEPLVGVEIQEERKPTSVQSAPVLRPSASDKPKETPSIFGRKKEKQESDEQVQSVLEKKEEAFTEEALQEVWKRFGEERINAGDTDRLILNREIRKGEENAVVIHLASQLEVSFLEKLEVDLIQYLRSSLNNDHIVLRREIIKDEEDNAKKLYTSKDIYEHMVRENPHLQDLKDRLGLDFDY